MKSKIKKITKQIEKLPEAEQELVKQYYKEKPMALLGVQRSLFKNCTDFPLFAQGQEEKQTSLFD